MNIGQRIRLTKDVERFPDFIARKGMTGTFAGHRMGVSLMEMDARLEGAEHWENCIIWNEDSDYSRFIEDDVEELQSMDVTSVQITAAGI
jgi:hypothetical protein